MHDDETSCKKTIRRKLIWISEFCFFWCMSERISDRKCTYASPQRGWNRGADPEWGMNSKFNFMKERCWVVLRWVCDFDCAIVECVGSHEDIEHI